ncbi:HD-GYP domain-containing protein [Candidatus Desantisbacteria bacterium]|nr:HD-GYP domain-containing protein [Candidatus Desantisbacteria bacterium]
MHNIADITETLSEILNQKDPYTHLHSKRVTGYAKKIAEAMELNPETFKTIIYGGLLHDIGKIYISKKLLLKPGPLTGEEFNIIQKHAKIGYMMLNNLNYFDNEKQIILYHHERFDGSGYPYGLHSDNIPINARILAVCDVYDAMTSDRPYRKALSSETALTELNNNKGILFDPDVVNTFSSLF